VGVFSLASFAVFNDDLFAFSGNYIGSSGDSNGEKMTFVFEGVLIFYIDVILF
jgi:hypothetical protein